MNKEIEEYFTQKIQQQIQPEDVLTEQEYQLWQRAQAGEIPCPWCEQPLAGSFYFFLDDGYQCKGVRLRCSGCGFDER
jgi:hypothetical protein